VKGSIHSGRGPKEKDGRPIVVTYPATLGRSTFITGAGDNLSPTPPATGRGDGPKLRIVYDGTEAGAALIKTVQFQFKEPVEAHDGEVSWSPVSEFSGADRFHFRVCVPQSQPGSDPGAGNLSVVGFPEGHPLYGAARYQYNGDGTGSHTSTDVGAGGSIAAFTQLFPSRTRVATTEGIYTTIGYWDINPLTGVMTPNALGEGEFDLVDAGTPLAGYIVKNVGMGNPRGVFEIEAYRVEWVHHSWIGEFIVEKSSVSNACEVNGWLLLFRAMQA